MFVMLLNSQQVLHHYAISYTNVLCY